MSRLERYTMKIGMRVMEFFVTLAIILGLCPPALAAEAAPAKTEVMTEQEATTTDAPDGTEPLPDCDVYALHPSGNYRYIGKMTFNNNEVIVTDVTGNPVTDAVVALQGNEVYVLCYATETTTEPINTPDAPDGAGQTISVDGNSATAEYTVEIANKSYSNMEYISEGSLALMEGVRRLLSENSGYSDAVALSAQAQKQFYEIAATHSLETARVAVNGATMSVYYINPINDGLSVLGGQWASFIRSITPNVQAAAQTATQVVTENAPEVEEAALAAAGAAGAAGAAEGGATAGVPCFILVLTPVLEQVLANAPGAPVNTTPTMN